MGIVKVTTEILQNTSKTQENRGRLNENEGAQLRKREKERAEGGKVDSFESEKYRSIRHKVCISNVRDLHTYVLILDLDRKTKGITHTLSSLRKIRCYILASIKCYIEVQTSSTRGC